MRHLILIALVALAGGFPDMSSAAIPNVDQLIANYPNGKSEEVKRMIGGGVDAAWITNTSAIRMSRAFNYSGAPIPAGPASSVDGMHTVNGGDRRHYAYRVDEFRHWLIATYGRPALSFMAGPYGQPLASLAGRKGVIVFVDCGWSDVSSHVDLWDGQKVVHQGHFERCKQVHLWESAPAAHQRFPHPAVLTSNVHVRSTPSTSAPVVRDLKAGTAVSVLDMAGSFAKIGEGQFVDHGSLKFQ
jgi:hypothetical protein